MEQQKWYQSWVVWVAFAGIILYVLKMAFKIDLYGAWDDIAGYVFVILCAFGIVNNPNEKNRLNIPAWEIEERKQDADE